MIIDLLYGAEDIEKRIKQYESDNEEMKITAITAYELLRHPKEIKRNIAKAILTAFPIYDFDKSAAEKAADIYIKLIAKDKQINENDILIAAIAFSKDEKLLTRDKKFAFIGDAGIEII